MGELARVFCEMKSNTMRFLMCFFFCDMFVSNYKLTLGEILESAEVVTFSIVLQFNYKIKNSLTMGLVCRTVGIAVMKKLALNLLCLNLIYIILFHFIP